MNTDFQDYPENTFEKPFPDVHLFAEAGQDGKTITITMPNEFVKANMAVAGDNNGRHRLVLDPIYGGHEVVGFIAGNGVKYGRLEVNAAAMGLKNLIPGKTCKKWCRQRERDILMSRMLADLCEQKAEPIREYAAPQLIGPPSPLPPPTIQEQPTAKLSFIDIEGAINFVNKWAEDNDAALSIEDNKLWAEVRRRIGGPKK